MAKLLRPLLSALALPLSLAALALFSQGRWPWYAVLLTAVLYAATLQSLPGLRRRPPLYTASMLYLALGLVLPPLGHILGLAGQRWFWLLISFGVEIGIALVIWVWIRPRFVKPGGVRLGTTTGLRRPVEISPDDRFLHLHVLGPTGSGKTVGVLGPLVRQDIRMGNGVLLLDPKGDLWEYARREAERAGRKAVALSPKEDPAVGIDLFAGPPEQAAETVAYALYGAFPSGHEFYRTVGQAMLRNAAQAVKEARPEATLQDLEDFLQSEDARRDMLLQARSKHVRTYFRDQVGGWSPRFRQDAFVGVQSAVAQLTANPWARSLFSARPAYDFDQLLSEGGMLLLALPEGEMGLAARAVGSFALLLFQAAALRRTAGGKPAFVYADEFQTFAQPGFAAFLAEARSHRVGAVLAHQHLGQLDKELRAAVLSNARNRVLLGGLSQQDLEQLRDSLGHRFVSSERGLREAPRFDYETLRRMPRGEAVAEIAAGGQLLPPVHLRLPRP